MPVASVDAEFVGAQVWSLHIPRPRGDAREKPIEPASRFPLREPGPPPRHICPPHSANQKHPATVFRADRQWAIQLQNENQLPRTGQLHQQHWRRPSTGRRSRWSSARPRPTAARGRPRDEDTFLEQHNHDDAHGRGRRRVHDFRGAHDAVRALPSRGRRRARARELQGRVLGGEPGDGGAGCLEPDRDAGRRARTGDAQFPGAVRVLPAGADEERAAVAHRRDAARRERQTEPVGVRPQQDPQAAGLLLRHGRGHKLPQLREPPGDDSHPHDHGTAPRRLPAEVALQHHAQHPPGIE
mmetsp:Transcript_24707/g.62095  ORF Transcript_24707/g.62095 Transcript_24707/m.62095 type:complete len:298 (-) Transcript_24707:2875-3768(-)